MTLAINTPSRIVTTAGSSLALLARVANLLSEPPGEPLTQADVTAAVLQIVDLEQASSAPDEVELEVADVLFDDLQVDDLWQADDQGYNLRVILDGALIPDRATT